MKLHSRRPVAGAKHTTKPIWGKDIPALKIEYRRPSELKPDPKNARRHDQLQKRLLGESMRAFGNVMPIATDRDGNIIAGHLRAEVAQQEGWEVVPIVRLEHLTPAQVKALRLADNRLAERAHWDERLVAETLKELSEAELNFNIEATGFTMCEIDLMIEEGMAPIADEEDRGEVVPRQGPAVSRAGDLWQLGPHRVLCGNALDKTVYRRLMDGQRASIVFTDPPFNVRIEGHASGLGAIRHSDFVMASGEMTVAEFTSFLTEACSLLALNSVDGSIHFVCMDWRHMEEVMAAGRASYSELKNLCVYVKNNAGMGSFYRSRHELIFAFKKGKTRHRNNIQLGQFGRNRSNVWEYPNIGAFGRGGEEGNLLALHPTVKPVALVADAIKDCSARGDVVLDAFLGSGTTVIAAERTGRRCYGLELDPAYVDTTVRRWQVYTGELARDAATGQSFDQLAAERSHGQ